MTDLPGDYRIRPATAADHADLMRVCLKTGDSGQDGTHLYDDPDLLGLVYAVPYQVFAPDFAFVLDGPEGVCGYVLGVPDTAEFQDWMDRVWYPSLRGRIDNPGPDRSQWQKDDWLHWRIFAPLAPFPVDPGQYPAQAHIDLLPEAQGKGLGRAMMARLCDAFVHAGCPGLFVEVSPRNPRAQAFYKHLGFRVLDVSPDCVIMAMPLGT